MAEKYTENRVGNFLNTDIVPPKGFLYCSALTNDFGQTNNLTAKSVEEAFYINHRGNSRVEFLNISSAE